MRLNEIHTGIEKSHAKVVLLRQVPTHTSSSILISYEGWLVDSLIASSTK
jgi:hypothetical protein